MSKRGGAFKSEKRKKELSRLKKQEEKRQRRFSGQTEKEEEIDTETTPLENIEKDIEKDIEKI